MPWMPFGELSRGGRPWRSSYCLFKSLHRLEFFYGPLGASRIRKLKDAKLTRVNIYTVIINLALRLRMLDEEEYPVNFFRSVLIIWVDLNLCVSATANPA